MGFTDIFPFFKGLTDLISEAIPDKDKQAAIRAQIIEVQARVQESFNALTAKLAELEASQRIAELGVKTYPWLDALHKMGRQINGWAFLLVVAGCQLSGHPLDPTTAASVAAVLGVYNYVKGKGQ